MKPFINYLFGNLTCHQRRTLYTLLPFPFLFCAAVIGEILIEGRANGTLDRHSMIRDNPGQILFESLLITLVADVFILALFVFLSKYAGTNPEAYIPALDIQSRAILPERTGRGDGLAGAADFKTDQKRSVFRIKWNFSPTDDRPIMFTPAALQACRTGFQKYGQAGDFLRVKLIPIGTWSTQYSLHFESKLMPGDVVMDCDGLTVVVGAESAKGLRGTVIDYVELGDGMGLTIHNPNVVGPETNEVEAGDEEGNMNQDNQSDIPDREMKEATLKPFSPPNDTRAK